MGRLPLEVAERALNREKSLILAKGHCEGGVTWGACDRFVVSVNYSCREEGKEESQKVCLMQERIPTVFNNLGAAIGG